MERKDKINMNNETHKVGTFFSFRKYKEDPAILLQLIETKYHEYQLIECFRGNRWSDPVYKSNQEGRLLDRDFIIKYLLDTEIIHEFRSLTLKEVSYWINSAAE